MNAEFVRNVWLELTARRVVFMVVVLALIFFAAAISGGSEYRPAEVAEFLYYFIVVFWGSRNAALGVVGEIRDRTWDSQRLSSLSPSAMTWGKLFGATIYNWFGGAICLAVILASRLTHEGVLSALADLFYFPIVGVISQAAALLASLIAARRRQAHSRLEIFTYQMAGLIAASAVYSVWEAADPAGSIFIGKKATDFVVWWGVSFDARPFLLASLAVFAGWILLGCYRAMRLELKMRNGPFVWLAFLGFMGAYTAGFDAWFTKGAEVVGWDVLALRLALAGTTFAVLTYAMVLLEPKDRVLYRFIGAEIVRVRIGSAFAGFQAWMMTYVATAAVAIALGLHLAQLELRIGGDVAAIAAALGFLTRDVAIFVLFQSLPGRRRGDFAAVVALFTLYVLIPAILRGLDISSALPFFFARPAQPLWLGPAAAWGEAMLVVVLALMRLAKSESGASAISHATAPG